jgi:hypothetical protein
LTASELSSTPSKNPGKEKNIFAQDQPEEIDDNAKEKLSQILLRREALHRLVFSWDGIVRMGVTTLTEALLNCNMLMLQIPHSIICQRSVSV